jgi:hypothetical protein
MEDYIETTESENHEDSFAMMLGKNVALTAATTAAMMTTMLAVPVAYGYAVEKLQARKAKKLANKAPDLQ